MRILRALLVISLAACGDDAPGADAAGGGSDAAIDAGERDGPLSIFKGSVAGLSFAQVDRDALELIPGGCQSALAGAAWDGPYGAPPMKPAPRVRRSLRALPGPAAGDAGPPDAGAFDAGPCLAAPSYPDAGTPTGAIYRTTDAQGTRHVFEGALDTGGDPYLIVELWDGLGAFAGGLRAGTFPIQDAETDYDTCGVCVLLLAGLDGTEYREGYFAVAGSVTVDSLVP